MPEQHDLFDSTLRDRIGAAEARVRVRSGPPDGLPAGPSTAHWLRPALVLATAAAAVMLAVFVIGQFPGRPTGDATPRPSPVEGISASARNGDFLFTLFSPRSTWTTEDAIEITATLSYDGAQPAVEIGGGGGPVVFSLVQLEGGDAVLGGGQDLPCLRYSLGPNSPLVWPFQKAGGINDEPPFDGAFFEDPQLRLPPGRWEVRAFLEYGVGDCSDLVLEVSIILDVVENEGSPGPSIVDDEPPPGSSPPSPTPSFAPSPSLEWTQTGAFPAPGPSMVRQIVAMESGLIAFGIGYDHQLPNLGPTPPHTAQVWLSDDGRSWQPVDLGQDFRNVDFEKVIGRADGSLLALGYRYPVSADNPYPSPEAAAWESVDGRTWTSTAYPLPGLAGDVVQGARGYVAFIRSPNPATEGDTLWHSSDGHTWEPVHSMEPGGYVRAIGAGSQGFVMSGQLSDGEGTTDESIVRASSDGRAWLEAPSPATGSFMVLSSLGDDWVAVRGFDPAISGETWFSANGLDWSSHGRAHLEELPLEGGVTCREYPHYLASAGPWLVMGTTLSFGCSEGGFVVHGTPQISLDGATWTRLPFEEGTPGQTRTGSAVNASSMLNGNLVLAGEHNGVATFWIGEPR